MSRILREKIFLIGFCSNSLTGSKLPSCRQVLKVLFFNLRAVKLSLRASAKLVVEELQVFWEKARIPTKDKQNCISKLEKLYQEWRTLQKNKGKPSNKTKADKWFENLDDLFDIAHSNALQSMSNAEDKAFLINQRQKGRPGFMYGIDYAAEQRENRKLERQQKFMQRTDRNNQQMALYDETVALESSSDSLESSSGLVALRSPPEKKLRASKKIINTKLAAALDACKISDRSAVHVISAVIESLGHNVQDYILNRSSIHNQREKIREERAAQLKNQLNAQDLNAICVHWDGKLLPALTETEKVDRLPIIITNGLIEQLLGIPTLKSGSGKEQASAVYNAISEWGLQKHIKAISFDTTAVNTGRFNGTCALLENYLQRKLLWLPCRHHIFEIVLRSVFELKISCQGSPNVQIFEKFKTAWPKLDLEKFECGIEDKYANMHLKDSVERIHKYVSRKLTEMQPRDDYKELLELTLIFLGKKPLKNHTSCTMFRTPGAVHHARWMAKAIYCLKIFLFRSQFKLSASEICGLRLVAVFIVEIYVEAWFSAPSAIEAPFVDFTFIQKLHKFRSIDDNMATVALKKFQNHLWYLSPEAVALAFFDEKVPIDVKEKMIEGLESNRDFKAGLKRPIVQDGNIRLLIDNGIQQFVSKETKQLFNRFGIDDAFLKLNPSKWNTESSYNSAKNILQHLKVVNDTAERGVKLMESYNKLLTKDEKQKQFILQVVTDYRRRFPNCSKQTLSQSF